MAAVIKTIGNGKALTRAEASAWGRDYDIGPNLEHLDDGKMIEVYQLQKQQHPNALISVDDHDCGHWTVTVYKTDLEKHLYFSRMLAELWTDFAKVMADLK